jgi:hypothetical protein
VNAVLDASHRQVIVVGVVDAKVQQEFLLHQFGLDHFDLDQMHLRFWFIIAEPGRTTAKPQKKEQGEHL